MTSTASASTRFVLLASTPSSRPAAAAPKRRFRLARLQLNPTGPPSPEHQQLRRAYD